MADAILGLLRSESERRRLGTAARARALERFTLETVLSGYRDSYAGLASPAQCGPDLDMAGQWMSRTA